MKKLVSLLLAAALCLGLGAPAFAADSKDLLSGSCGQYLIWTFDKTTGTLTISGKGGMASWSGDPRRDPSPWLGFLQDIRTVVIQEGVTSVSAGAFCNAANLTRVELPKSVTEIGAAAFTGTLWLKSQGEFAVANGVLFAYQGDGEKVVIPDGVTGVADNAFGWFIGAEGTLGNLSLPASVRDLNAAAAFTQEWPPRSVTYEGGRDQWNEVEGTEWLTENKIPVRCLGAADPTRLFTDLKPDGYYLDAVAWAVQKEITTGTTKTTFSPAKTCTHGQILTFLWRALDKPESSVVLPFTVKEDAYCLGAAKWAYERGMIGPMFQHGTGCTRADAVRYIWQAMGKPYAVYDGRFTDVPANSPYAQAVAWAVAAKVTEGTAADRFSPDQLCQRGQIVTFLHRAYQRDA